MLRYFPFVLSMAAAFFVGFFLVSALLGNGPDGPVVTLTLDRGGAEPSSTHAKSRLVVRPTRQAALPPPPVEQAVRPSPRETARSAPVSRSLTKLVAFKTSPFPYNGLVPQTQRPFLNFEQDGQLGRKTSSGRIYWAHTAYSDRRVLLHIPKGFDTRRPSVMVVFFHGHGATLQRDVADRQQVPAQVTGSEVNAVLVAPQFAVDARDSSAGNLWQPGGMRRFLDEVADKLTQVHGDPKARRTFATMPVVIVGYSGGYLPTASVLANGHIEERIKGVVLLDGLYGELDKFADWIERDNPAFFLSAYTGSTQRGNDTLKETLARRNIPYRTEVGAMLRPGSVTFVEANEEHRNYVTRAWAVNPIADLLARLPGIAPRAPVAVSASLAPAFTQ